MRYEMVKGRRPFESCPTSALAGDILYKPAASPRQFNPDISPRVEEVILKCLETRTVPIGEGDLRRCAAPSIAHAAVIST